MATRAEVGVGIGLVAVAAAFLPVVLQAQDDRAGRSKCANNLRQLGLAAIMYADDKRFFPHLGKMAELDGGYATNSSTKIVRTLVWYGYHDAPEGFVCPSSADEDLPVPDRAKENMRRWFWGGEAGKASETLNPLVDGAADPALSQTTELSYGWSRRGMNANVRSTALLSADRGRDNHRAGWHVGWADGTVNWTPDGPNEQARLTSTDARTQDAGYLGIQAPNDPPLPGGHQGPPPAWAGTYADADVSLTLEPRAAGFRGVLIVRGTPYDTRGTLAGGAFQGEFFADRETYTFTARLEGAVLVLTSGRRTYRLQKR